MSFMAENPFSPSATGAIYPTDYMTGIIHDHEDAEKAVADLAQANFDTKDIVLFTSKQAIDKLQDAQKQQGLLGKIMGVFAGVASDTGGQYHLLYEKAAREGQHILNVYAPTLEQQDLAHAILKAHHGHTIKFFGQWAVRDFP
jgi:hypothetical protein